MDETRERGVVPIVCLRKGCPIPLTAIPTDEWSASTVAAPPSERVRQAQERVRPDAAEDTRPGSPQDSR